MNEPERDETFEREFLELVARQAGLWDQTLDFKSYTDAVRQRLRKGMEEYGPGSFLTADRGEVNEEAADLGAWPMLFAQASLKEGAMEDISDYVYIAALGALAYQRARQIQGRRPPRTPEKTPALAGRPFSQFHEE